VIEPFTLYPGNFRMAESIVVHGQGNPQQKTFRMRITL
jgi:hypothetical protein